MKLGVLFLVLCYFTFGNCQNICKTPCWLSDWGTWSSCSTTCGPYGKRERYQWRVECFGNYRVCRQQQVETCNRVCCPKACSYYYTAWSSCVGCGNHGTQSRRLVIRRQPKCGGRACPRAGTSYRSCNPGR